MGDNLLDSYPLVTRLKRFAQLDYHANCVPYEEVVLVKRRHTHFLVWELPLSIIKLRNAVPELFSEVEPWYDNLLFANEPGGRGAWRLLRSDPVSRSLNKPAMAQTRLLRPDETVASAHLVVCAMVLCRLGTNRWMFRPDLGVRSSNVTPSRYSIIVGCGHKRIGVTMYRADLPISNVGIAAVVRDKRSD